MKTILLSLALFLAACLTSKAVTNPFEYHFTYRYTFSTGEYFTGQFYAEIDYPEILWNVNPSDVYLYSAAGELLSTSFRGAGPGEDDIDAGYHTIIPKYGEYGGLNFGFLLDSGEQGKDFYVSVGSNGTKGGISGGYFDEEKGISLYETNGGRWELSPKLSVPESPATLGLLSLSLLGLAGVKRGWRR